MYCKLCGFRNADIAGAMLWEAIRETDMDRDKQVEIGACMRHGCVTCAYVRPQARDEGNLGCLFSISA